MKWVVYNLDVHKLSQEKIKDAATTFWHMTRMEYDKSFNELGRKWIGLKQ